jgi:general secretion pathway protein G
MRTRSGRSGFTLIELLVVMAILGLLLGIVAPQFLNRLRDADRKAAVTQIGAFKTALELYMLDNHEPPSSQQGLDALIVEPTSTPRPTNWRPYLKDVTQVPLDPWGNPYHYESPGPNGEDYYIVSYGADGSEGGDGEWDADINSTDLRP